MNNTTNEEVNKLDQVKLALDEALSEAKNTEGLIDVVIGMTPDQFSQLRKKMDTKTFVLLKYILEREEEVKYAIDQYNYYSFNVKMSGIMMFFIGMMCTMWVYADRYWLFDVTGSIGAAVLERTYLFAPAVTLMFCGCYNIFDGLRIPYMFKRIFGDDEEEVQEEGVALEEQKEDNEIISQERNEDV